MKFEPFQDSIANVIARRMSDDRKEVTAMEEGERMSRKRNNGREREEKRTDEGRRKWVLRPESKL